MLPISAVGLAQHSHISGLDNILDCPAVTLLLLAFKNILAWLGFPLWWPVQLQGKHCDRFFPLRTSPPQLRCRHISRFSSYDDQYNVIITNKNNSKNYKNKTQVVINQNDPLTNITSARLSVDFIHPFPSFQHYPRLSPSVILCGESLVCGQHVIQGGACSTQ